jgi:hypothetical protein
MFVYICIFFKHTENNNFWFLYVLQILVFWPEDNLSLVSKLVAI